MTVVVAKDAEELAVLGAELLARAIHGAVAARGRASIALSGGTTPLPAYERLAALDLPWERVGWFFVDERAVAPDAPRSNAGAIGKALPAMARGAVARMRGEEPLEAEAARYEAELRSWFGVASAVRFDAMTLGVGDDGHTASLFPGTGDVRLDGRLVAAIPARPERGLEARLTLTRPVLLEAASVVVLARGAGKRGPLEAAWAEGDEDEVPARLLRAARGEVTWLLDEAAAPASS